MLNIFVNPSIFISIRTCTMIFFTYLFLFQHVLVQWYFWHYVRAVICHTMTDILFSYKINHHWHLQKRDNCNEKKLRMNKMFAKHTPLVVPIIRKQNNSCVPTDPKNALNYSTSHSCNLLTKYEDILFRRFWQCVSQIFVFIKHVEKCKVLANRK